MKASDKGRARGRSGALSFFYNRYLPSESVSTGQALVEFAIILPVLVLLLLGVLDLGRSFNAYIIITNAAREGASYGSMHPNDTTGIIQRTLTEAQSSGIVLNASNVTITTTRVSGTPMQVTVIYNFQLFWLSLLGRPTLSLRSAAQMVIY